jgi:hypothetical protein
VGALSHHIERQGVATVGISLIREHTERIRPPRALWVPFELGRPLGVPNDRGFQAEVARAALRLLERTDTPVLEDYPVDAPDQGAEAGWACNIPLPGPDPADGLASRVLGEVARLRPWFDEGLRRRGRTLVGSSGLTADGLPDAVRALDCFVRGEVGVTVTHGAQPWPSVLRYIVDDLRAYYTEAVLAQPGSVSPSSWELGRWLYGETALGELLEALQRALGSAEDPRLRAQQRRMIPTRFAGVRDAARETARRGG